METGFFLRMRIDPNSLQPSKIRHLRRHGTAQPSGTGRESSAPRGRCRSTHRQPIHATVNRGSGNGSSAGDPGQGILGTAIDRRLLRSDPVAPPSTGRRGSRSSRQPVPKKRAARGAAREVQGSMKKVKCERSLSTSDRPRDTDVSGLDRGLEQVKTASKLFVGFAIPRQLGDLRFLNAGLRPRSHVQ